jgi:hypothetical protein
VLALEEGDLGQDVEGFDGGGAPSVVHQDSEGVMGHRFCLLVVILQEHRAS